MDRPIQAGFHGIASARIYTSTTCSSWDVLEKFVCSEVRRPGTDCCFELLGCVALSKSPHFFGLQLPHVWQWSPPYPCYGIKLATGQRACFLTYGGCQRVAFLFLLLFCGWESWGPERLGGLAMVPTEGMTVLGQNRGLPGPPICLISTRLHHLDTWEERHMLWA